MTTTPPIDPPSPRREPPSPKETPETEPGGRRRVSFGEAPPVGTAGTAGSAGSAGSGANAGSGTVLAALPLEPPGIKSDAQGGGLRLSGAWTVLTLHQVSGELRRLVKESSGPLRLDAVTRLDSAGALVINLAARALADRGASPQILTDNPRYAKLLETAVPPPVPEQKPRPAFFVHLMNDIGKTISEQFRVAAEMIGFFGQYLVCLIGLLLRPHRMRWTSLVFHMDQAGLRAVPIVALLTFLIGMVVAYMGSQALAQFGAQVFAVNLLEVTIMREMGVLITAIVVAGRSSSSFTAQIGAMIANEEVAAMRSMGLDPMHLLVVPRVLALTLTLPLLVFIADIMALLGGATAVWYSIDLNLSAFISKLYEIASLKNFLVGIVKTPFFAMSIGIVGCFQGFQATGSAQSVGFLTTTSVVEAIFTVILLDALFAIFFTTIGV